MSEPTPAGPPVHILNFYEDLDMPLVELHEVIEAALSGKLGVVEEKLDGQNITFTVRDGAVELFSKGVSASRVAMGGKRREDIVATYSSNSQLQAAFVEAYDSLQELMDLEPELVERVFHDGKVVVEALMMLPENPNTVLYSSPTIRFVRAYSMDPFVDVDDTAYATLVSVAQRQRSRVRLGSVPLLRPRQVKDSDAKIASLSSRLNALTAATGLNSQATVGDLIGKMVEKRLIDDGNVAEWSKRAAYRLVSGDKSSFSRQDAERIQPGSWKKLQDLETGRYVDKAMIPLEAIVQELGSLVLEELEFELASNDPKSGERMRSFVRKARQSFVDGKIFADPDKLSGIRTALERIGDRERLFVKDTEGIVFNWRGKVRKLTGMFTPFNRLRGFFVYGKEPARFVESRDIYIGGDAMKRWVLDERRLRAVIREELEYESRKYDVGDTLDVVDDDGTTHHNVLVVDFSPNEKFVGRTIDNEDMEFSDYGIVTVHRPRS